MVKDCSSVFFGPSVRPFATQDHRIGSSVFSDLGHEVREHKIRQVMDPDF